jgi:hypothetical protein
MATATDSYLIELRDYLDELEPRMEALAESFSKEGFLVMEDFGPPELRAAVTAEVDSLLAEQARRRNVKIASTENTPRIHDTVARSAIFEHGVLIPAIYRSPDVSRFLTRLLRRPEIVNVPYEPEQIVINSMAHTGDTHGWHWDDYPYVMIWIIEATTERDGGVLEFVCDTTWDKSDPQIDQFLSTRSITRSYPPTGSVYFLRSDTALHRVTPLTRDGAVRTILAYSFAAPEDLERTITHESMEEIYPDEPQNADAVQARAG